MFKTAQILLEWLGQCGEGKMQSVRMTAGWM